MNNISLTAKTILDKEFLIIDGIEFANAVIIQLAIDCVLVTELKNMEISLVVFPELIDSLSGNGRYLIFTSASGIADEGGWAGVDVKYKGNVVEWDFEIEGISYHFEFNFLQYERELCDMKKTLKDLINKFDLEPTEFFLPEEWE